MLKPPINPVYFKLYKKTREDILAKEVNWGLGALSATVFYRTYSRVKDNGKFETWNDCVIRVIEGMFTILKTHSHQTGISWDEKQGQKLAAEAAERLFEFKWTPPGRGLWTMGTDLIWDRGSAALQNCGFVSTEEMDNEDVETIQAPFKFLGDFSFYGVGVGFDTLGTLNDVSVLGYNEDERVPFQVPDTREGWVDAMMYQLMNGLTNGPRINFDTSLIRKKGSPIKGFGGEAPGPLPLIYALAAIEWVVDRDSGINSKMTSAFIVDIQNIIGRAVVSGGIRRVAEIALGLANDPYFSDLKNTEKYPVENGAVPPIELQEINPKDYDEYFERMDEITEKYQDEPWAFKFGGWRWASNNSLLDEDVIDYHNIQEKIKASRGEPGIFYRDLSQKYSRLCDPPNNKDYRARGTNPCAEQTLESFELCCLVENFPTNHDDYWDFQRTLKFSYLYAKSVTLIGTHNEKTNNVMNRNRRIGCSMTGVTDAIEKFTRKTFLREFCNEGFSYIEYIDRKYSDWLGVRESIKKTSIKPSGTVSLLGGCKPAGVHFPKMKSGWRIIQMSKDSPLVKPLREAGYKIEASYYNPVTTVAVYFPWLTSPIAKADEEATMWEKVKLVADMQYWWADNQVSNTITYSEDEADDISTVLEAFEGQLKSASFLPISTSTYEQMPFTNAPREDVEEYEATLKKIDWNNIKGKIDVEAQQGNQFCDGDACVI